MSKKYLTKGQKALFKRLPRQVKCFLIKLFTVEELAGMFETREQLAVLYEQASFELTYGLP